MAIFLVGLFFYGVSALLFLLAVRFLGSVTSFWGHVISRSVREVGHGAASARSVFNGYNYRGLTVGKVG